MFSTTIGFVSELMLFFQFINPDFLSNEKNEFWLFEKNNWSLSNKIFDVLNKKDSKKLSVSLVGVTQTKFPLSLFNEYKLPVELLKYTSCSSKTIDNFFWDLIN